MAKNEDFIYVESGTGKPVHLIDTGILIDGKPMEISIDSRMIREKVSLKVNKTPFVLNAVNSGSLVLVDKDMVKIDSETFLKKVEIENETKEAESVATQADNLMTAFETFQDAVEKSVNLKPSGSKKQRKSFDDQSKI